MEARERQELQQEGLGDGGGVGGPGVERSHPREQQHEQTDVALVLLGHLVDGLEHRLSGRERTEVAPERRNGERISAWLTVSRAPLPRYTIKDTCVNGSNRAPNREVVLRMPLATARTLPEPWVITVTILSASPSLCDRRTTPCSL